MKLGIHLGGEGRAAADCFIGIVLNQGVSEHRIHSNVMDDGLVVGISLFLGKNVLLPVCLSLEPQLVEENNQELAVIVSLEDSGVGHQLFKDLELG